MNKKLLLVMALMGATAVNAQVPQKPLVEHFTQASCGPCASQNPTLKATLDAFGAGNYVKVTHQVSWPGSDPMYNEFEDGPDDRVAYYGVTGVPNASLNGGATDGPNTVVTSATLATAAALTTPYQIVTSHTWTSTNAITVDIAVTNTTGADVSSADKIYVSMLEEEIIYPSAPGSNGETEFYYVMRQMYDAATSDADATAGSALGTIAAGATQNFTVTIPNVPTYIKHKGKVMFAVYLQNNASKTVYQAEATTPSTPPGALDVAAIGSSVAASGMCDYAFTPGVEFTNNDATDVTEVVAEYSINGGAPVQETFSGTLTNGQSTVIAFPATTLSPGTSNISYSIVSVNGGQNWVSGSAITIANESYSKLSSTGVAAPVSEGMESAPLVAGTGYSHDLTTALFSKSSPAITALNFAVVDGPTYNLGQIGGMAASNRSVLYQFYGVQSGGVMDLIMQPVNLTTGSTLGFNHSYCQYSSENDELDVAVSTDCGATWTSVWNKSGSDLATSAASTSQYFPSTADQWASNVVDLAAYNNTDNVIIRFRGTSNYGNNLLIDDINLGNIAAVEDLTGAEFSVYPNPAVESFKVELKEEASNAVVEVLNLNGQAVYTQAIAAGQNAVEVNTTGLATGVYTVRVKTDAGVATDRVVIK